MGLVSFQVSEASPSPLLSGSHQSFTVSENDTLKVFSCPACQTVSFQPLPSGMTCERCTSLSDQSTSSTVGSHAKTSPLPVLVRAWQESEADFTSSLKELSEKQSRLSSSLKTSLQSGHADLVVWCGDFPSWGMTSGGQLCLPRKLEPRTLGKDGFSWPTPHANCHTGAGHGPNKTGAPNLQTVVGGKLNPTWLEWLMNYPQGWTELRPWAMPLCRPKRAKRSGDCVV